MEKKNLAILLLCKQQPTKKIDKKKLGNYTRIISGLKIEQKKLIISGLKMEQKKKLQRKANNVGKKFLHIS